MLFVVDVTVGVTEEDERGRRPPAGPGQPGARGGQQGRRHESRERRLGASVPRPRRPASGQRAARPAAPATCSTCSSTPCPRRGRRTPTATEGEDRAGDPGGGHRRPAQRRQVHAVQPAHRRRALGRARHARHHPRHHRHRRRDRRRAGALRRHRRHAPQGKIDEGTEYYSLVRALQAVDRADVALLVIDATEGVTHQDQRLAERARRRRVARSSCCSTSGSCSTPSSAELTSEQVGDRLHFLGERRCSRSAPSPARACTSCCPRWTSRSTTYHRRVPTRKVNEVHPPGAGRPAGARTAPGSSTPPRAPPIRRRSRCSPTASSRPPTCATSSGSSARPSTSGDTPLKLRVRRAT